MSNDSPIATDLNGFQRALKELEAQDSSADIQWRCHAGLLALGHNVAAWAEPSTVLSNAAKLISAVLRADLHGFAEIADDDAPLTLTIHDPARQSRGEDSAIKFGNVGRGASMVFYALAAAQPVFTSNLAAEKRFSDPLLQGLGVASALVIPLQCAGRSFGALGAYWRSLRGFAAEEVEFAGVSGGLLVSSVARARLDADLHRHRALAGAVLDTVKSLVLMLDAQGNVVTMNRACREVTGFAPADFRGRPVWSVLFAPEKAEAIQKAIQSFNHGPCSLEAELITKHGDCRQANWILDTVPGSEGESRVLVLTGTDCTDLVEAQRKMERLRQHVAKLAATLEDSHGNGRTRPEPDAVPSDRNAIDQRTGRERRTSVRSEFRCKQWIAPMREGRMPAPAEFFEVECSDISAGGFSFLFDREPEFETLAVVLGKAPQEVVLAARIVRCTSHGSMGRIRMRIGCRFLSRLSLPDLPQRAEMGDVALGLPLAATGTASLG
ncbi:MAG: PAS domain S-box protein [Thermoguttaceae bacterium]